MSRKKMMKILTLLLGLMTIFGMVRQFLEENNQQVSQAINDISEVSEDVIENRFTVTFKRKVDGDTAVFQYQDEEFTCRFLAIDTPETVKPDTPVQPFGKEASIYTESRLTEATEIWLEFDEKSDKQDKYDRVLAWVWVDGSLLQEELVQSGLAKVAYVYDDYKYVDRLEEAQKQAKEKGIGIWEK